MYTVDQINTVLNNLEDDKKKINEKIDYWKKKRSKIPYSPE